ncbi:MAG: DUF2997 domain-containing protein [Deltaproteobacteria bacterium]|nr:DUF2997 domain-containing protein [Deltaproteobacteria bacterium]
MVKKLKFLISPEGEIELRVEGAEGRECENFSKPFDSALGTISHREYLDSYYTTQTQSDTLHTEVE